MLNSSSAPAKDCSVLCNPLEKPGRILLVVYIIPKSFGAVNVIRLLLN